MSETMTEGQLLYAPALEVQGARVPLVDLAEYLRRQEYLSGIIPSDAPYVVFRAGEVDVIAFPMSPADFLVRGAFLLQSLNQTAADGDEDSASEFLHCFHAETDGREDLPPPAHAIYATLFLSTDGERWVEWREFLMHQANPSAELS